MKKQVNLSTILRATRPTPLLNRPDFDSIFKKLPVDEQGLLREVEMIAFPNTRFEVIKEVSSTIAEVATEDYSSESPLYIDTRFTTEDPSAPPRLQTLPPPEKILSRLVASLGLPYIWGGNWGSGILEIADFYPNSFPKDEATYLLRGVDCSGLLYEATGGYTPRNTSDLISFGENVPSLSDVKPLDIIVWPGHVLICLTKDTLIESLRGQGVVLSPLSARMARLESSSFKIRRFL